MVERTVDVTNSGSSDRFDADDRDDFDLREPLVPDENELVVVRVTALLPEHVEFECDIAINEAPRPIASGRSS